MKSNNYHICNSRVNVADIWRERACTLSVCATGDVHFQEPEDEVYRHVILASKKFADADEPLPIYFKTTDEMLEEFSYLGAAKAHEVVIDNPKMIADQVEPLRLFPKHPEGKETFQPLWEEAADDIQNRSWSTAKALYGDPLPEIIQTEERHQAREGKRDALHK